MAVVTRDVMQSHDIAPEMVLAAKFLCGLDRFYFAKTCLSPRDYADNPKRLNNDLRHPEVNMRLKASGMASWWLVLSAMYTRCSTA